MLDEVIKRASDAHGLCRRAVGAKSAPTERGDYSATAAGNL